MLPPAVTSELPPEAITALASYHLSCARQLVTKGFDHAKAREIERWIEDRFNRLYSASDIVDAYIATGLSSERAIDAVHRMTGTPIVTLEAHHRRRTRERQDAARQRRNIAIMRLAARGWQNKRIAQKVGLVHPNSVSRIIQRQLRVNAAGPWTGAAWTRTGAASYRIEPSQPDRHETAASPS